MMRHFALVAALHVHFIDAFVHHLVATRPDSALHIHFEDFEDLVTDGDDGRLPLPLSAGDVYNGVSSPDDESHSRPFERLESVLLDLYGPAISSETSRRLAAEGFAGDAEVVLFARGFVSREERISTALIDDFGWKAMDAHRARVGIVGLLSAVGIGREEGLDPGEESRVDGSDKGKSFQSSRKRQLSQRNASNGRKEEGSKLPSSVGGPKLSQTTPTEAEDSSDAEAPPESEVRASWKSVVINDQAKLRRSGRNARDPTTGSGPSKSKPKTSRDAYNYGLLPNTEDNADRRTYRTLYEELDALWTYMTVQQASSVSGEWRRLLLCRLYTMASRELTNTSLRKPSRLNIRPARARKDRGGLHASRPSVPGLDRRRSRRRRRRGVHLEGLGSVGGRRD